LMAFPLTLAGYKEKKIYKRFDATPAGKGQIILAQVLVNVAMTFSGIVLLLLLGKILYHTRIQGSIGSVCVSLVICIAAMFSMGFLFTAIGRDAKITNLLCYLFYFVMLFLSGATIPDMLFPESGKSGSKFLPMTHAVDLMQGVFAGESLGSHGAELLVLGAVTILFTGGGAVLYQKKDWA
ncbi:MAG: ABC transporter permease, partial [Lachnospiraceae bacterium]|nr:ABC transporter permease [Lachnospiraceae bacterium]